MKTLKQLAAVLTGLVIMTSCHKELSFETNSNYATAQLGDSASCYCSKARGSYIKDVTLTDSNYLLVNINVLTPGLYNIKTNSANGFYFADSGFFVNSGSQTLRLQGTGRPITAGVSQFQLTFNGATGCTINVRVLDSAINYSTFQLIDTGYSVQGFYETGTSLNSTNIIILNVRVDAPGFYSITTGPDIGISQPVNGMFFTATGIFTTTGVQSVILTGAGQPDSSIVTVMYAQSEASVYSPCHFFTVAKVEVDVTGADYFPTTDSSYWTYQLGAPGDTSKTTVLTGSKTFGGNSYKRFLTVSPTYGNDTSYYRKLNGIYYQYGNMNPPQPVRIYDTVFGATEFIFLKDNVGVGATWTSDSLPAVITVPGPPPASDTGKASIIFTITAKNVSVTVGPSLNLTVNTVIKVTRDYHFKTSAGNDVLLGTADFYYAKNLGFMKAMASSPIPITIYARYWDVKP